MRFPEPIFNSLSLNRVAVACIACKLLLVQCTASGRVTTTAMALGSVITIVIQSVLCRSSLHMSPCVH